MEPSTWQANAQATLESGTTHFTLYKGEKVLSFSKVIIGWKTDAAFRAFFNELLAQSPYAAFFWETPPVRQATAAAPFEFVLVDSKTWRAPLPILNLFGRILGQASRWLDSGT